jgi:hypothetical protein
VRGYGRFLALSGTITALVLACGSRTGFVNDQTIFEEGGLPEGGSTPLARDVTVIPGDTGPIFEGGPLDVVTDCPFPTVCEPNDPGYVYKCGQRIYQCSSLEQCENTCQGDDCGAQCVNPCMDTLGQNTSNGCEFFPIEIDTANEVAGSCFAVFIINQWNTGQPARIQVDQGGTILPIDQFARIPVGQGVNITYQPYDSTVGLAQNQVAILFLSRDPAALNDPITNDPRVLANCPPGVTPAVVGDAALHGTGIGTAFHIATNVPVVAYQMLPYGGGSARVTGATLLLPTNVWDTNYLAVNAYAEWELEADDRGEPTLDIIAQRDETHITIAPVTAIEPGDDGGMPGSPAGTPTSYVLNRGQYLQISQDVELTGSPIVADAPIAVIGGSTLLDVPISCTQRADGAEQMLPPVSALGSEYVAVRYRSRPVNGAGYDSGTWWGEDGGDAGVVETSDGGFEEVVPWRVVGAVDGTILTYDPAPPSGAPLSLNAKQLVEFDATGPFVVRSQDSAHPFYFASYMTGGEPFDGDGDPEFVNVVPPAQFLPRYTFFTDPTYPETNLVIVRARDATTGLMPDVTLDCAGLLGGWTPVDSAGRFQFTRLDLSTGDFVGQNGCDNGVHTIVGTLAADAGSSTPAFGVTVWGWGNDITLAQDIETDPLSTRWVSYGYPAGANFTRLNSVIVPAQ